MLLAMLLFSRGETPDAGVFISHVSSETVSGSLVVEFAPSVSRGQREAVLSSAELTIEREILDGRFVSVSVPAGREEEVGRDLAEIGAVDVVELEPLRYPLFTPNDPGFAEQWNFELIQLEQAWDEFPLDASGAPRAGDGAIVAIVDTGVAYEDQVELVDGMFEVFRRAPDLAPRGPDLAGPEFVSPWDFVNENEHANDDNGHGTHMAGTIGQTTNNWPGPDDPDEGDATISGKTAKTVFEKVFESGDSPQTIVEELGLKQITSGAEITGAVEKVIADNPKPVQDYQNGKEEAIKFLVGQVMRETRGRASPDAVVQALREKLDATP